MHALSAGGRAETYAEGGENRFTVEELLRPFEAVAHLCRMRWRPPFVVHASHLQTSADLAEAARAYRAQVLALMRE
jgi:glutathione-regulated potassium-efflux system ancillary protein KefG